MKKASVAAAATLALAPLMALYSPVAHADQFAACNALATPTDRGYCMDKILAGGQAPAGPPAAAPAPAPPPPAAIPCSTSNFGATCSGPLSAPAIGTALPPGLPAAALPQA